MKRRLRVRLIPTNEQERLFKLHIEANIEAWNFAINQQKSNYADGNKLNLSTSQLYKLFYQEFPTKYSEVSTQTIYNAFRENMQAYKKFFKKIRGKPHTHEPRNVKSFYVRHDGLYFKNGYANVEKIGKVRIKTNYSNEELGNARGDKKFGDPNIKWDGRYWMLSFVVEVDKEESTLSDDVIGIDVGVKNFAICSDGTIFESINKTSKMIKLQKMIDKENHNISRMLNTNGNVVSSNVKKQREKLNKLLRRQRGVRDNYIHQVSSTIVNKLPKVIVIENLDIVSLAKKKGRAKLLYDQKIAKFYELLKYKAEGKGILVIEADRYFPSSKTCSNCGAVKSKISLKERTFHCDECDFTIDRDLNAAINLRNLAK